MMKTLAPLALGVMFAAGAAQAQTGADASMFPEPKAQMARHVFTLPQQNNESALKIEIVAGKVIMGDCNQIMIGADLEEETLQGWGYNFYEITDVSQPASTLMGCPDGSKTEKMVELNFGDDSFQRYNSKLPLVVYAPADLKVGYRIWSTDGKRHGIDGR